MRSFNRSLAAGATLLAAMILYPAAASAADLAGDTAESAARPTLEMPFGCGEVRQGATYTGHGGGDNYYPLDFNRGSGNDDYGDPVVASADGTAEVWTEPDGDRTIRIHHNAEWSTDYQHLSEFLINDGDTVTRGQLIGRVGNSGTTFAHLHYEQRHNGVATHIYFHGGPLNPTYSFEYNGPSYTSQNC